MLTRSPPKVEGGYSPMNMAKNTRCRVSSSINLADHRQMRVDQAMGGRGGFGAPGAGKGGAPHRTPSLRTKALRVTCGPLPTGETV
jgi:hypothetical protein